MRDILIEDLMKNEQIQIIDIRSPIEFHDGTIPGAINIPLFTDEQRKEIGTIYKQTGQKEAQWRAMELVSPKIPTLLGKLKSIAEEREVVVFCWRGGMRSKAVATFASFSGIKIQRLAGGYKAYRQYILTEMASLLPPKAIVLHGLTGIGKTEILASLKSKGYPVLDLEKAAGHRGSLFGGIGQKGPFNQKTFDSLLFSQLQSIQGESFFFVEAESKRIGHATQPEFLYEKKRNGIHININVPMVERIKRIKNDYIKPYEGEEWFQQKVIEILTLLRKWIHSKELSEEIANLYKEKNYDKLIETLLLFYYDPKYYNKKTEYDGPFHTLNCTNVPNSVEQIEKIVEQYQLTEIQVKKARKFF